MKTFDPNAAVTGAHQSLKDQVAPEGDAGQIHYAGGVVGELSKRAGAWLNWRAGLGPKPDFKMYDPKDRRTWFRAPALDSRAQRRAARALMFAKLAKEGKK